MKFTPSIVLIMLLLLLLLLGIAHVCGSAVDKLQVRGIISSEAYIPYHIHPHLPPADALATPAGIQVGIGQCPRPQQSADAE